MWGLVDDELHGHPKVAALLEEEDGAAAMGLWVLALSWSRRYRTEGRIPRGQCDRLVGQRGQLLADLLAKVGLWDRVAIGVAFQFHDWAGVYRRAEDEQFKAADISAKRSEAGKKGAANRWRKPDNSMANENGKNGNVDGPSPDPLPISDRAAVPDPDLVRIEGDFVTHTKDPFSASLQQLWMKQFRWQPKDSNIGGVSQWQETLRSIRMFALQEALELELAAQRVLAAFGSYIGSCSRPPPTTPEGLVRNWTHVLRVARGEDQRRNSSRQLPAAKVDHS